MLQRLGSCIARLGSMPKEERAPEFRYAQKQCKSACPSAMQHWAVGAVGFGGVTAGRHAYKPAIGMLQMDWASPKPILLTTINTNAKATTFIALSILIFLSLISFLFELFCELFERVFYREVEGRREWKIIEKMCPWMNNNGNWTKG